jgi:hypothetical protein
MPQSSQYPVRQSTDPGRTQRVFVLPPALGDGASRSLVKPDEMPFLDLFNILEEWLDGADDGEEITIGWRLVAEGELEALEDDHGCRASRP